MIMNFEKEFKEEFKEAYQAKKIDDINVINKFCTKWEKLVTVEHIPYFMRLYYDDVSTCEQNEFITGVLDSIIKVNLKEAIKRIIQYLDILEEEAEECFSYIVIVIVFWNKEQIACSAKIIANAEEGIGEKFVKDIKDTLNKTEQDSIKTIAEKFINLYYKEKKKGDV